MSIKEDSFIYKLIHNMSRRIYHAADKVLVSSPSFKEYLMETIGLEGKKIQYLPQYTDEINNDVASITELHQNQNIVEKDKMVQFTFAGNIGLVQDLETVVEAAAKIKDKDFIINIVGSGSHEENIKRLVVKSKLSNHFVFHGRKNQKEMDEIYGYTDVCILTLRNDDFIGRTIPGKLQTYMGKGKAILGAISNDSMSIIQEANAGLCVESGDEIGLSQLMVEYIDKPELIRVFGDNAKVYYYNNFRKERFIDSLLNILKGE